MSVIGIIPKRDNSSAGFEIHFLMKWQSIYRDTCKAEARILLKVFINSRD
jgi:hypothetical protein